MKSTLLSFYKKTSKGVFYVFILIFFLFRIVSAQVMQSTTYKIQSDSINIGGNENSTSTNYSVSDTLGEVGTGSSNSANYYMQAGYRQMQESYISISSPADVSLGSISGLTGGIGTGSAVWTVTTDNMGGYSMSIKSSTNPSMTSSGSNFPDYTPSTSDPDFTFINPSNNSNFGFSPEGTDILAKYKDNGSVCNSGSSDTVDKCWDGFSTTSKDIVNRQSSNHPNGTNTTIKFRAESGSSNIKPSGVYTSTITVTAITL